MSLLVGSDVIFSAIGNEKMHYQLRSSFNLVERLYRVLFILSKASVVFQNQTSVGTDAYLFYQETLGIVAS